MATTSTSRRAFANEIDDLSLPREEDTRKVPAHYPDDDQKRNILGVAVTLALLSFLLGFLVCAIILLFRREPTYLEKRCDEVIKAIDDGETDDTVEVDPILLNQCREILKNCNFDATRCAMRCPFGYGEDPITKCPHCQCAFQGVHEFDISFEEDDIPKMLQAYGYQTDASDFSTYTSSSAILALLWNEIKVGGRFKIPYEIDEDMATKTPQKVANIEKALKEISKATCIDFQKRTAEEQFMRFSDKSKCMSKVGRSLAKHKSGQIISVGPGCDSRRIIKHEMLHALGFHHEHSRPDRNHYITVHLENIQPDLRSNFVRMYADASRELGVEYDLRSIMQYEGTAVSSNGKNTITIRKNQKPTGPPPGDMSDVDVRELNILYDCEPSVIGLPTTGSWTEWGQWTECSITCRYTSEKSYQWRYRRCVDNKDDDVAGCSGEKSERKECEVEDCEGRDWGLWTGWTWCSVTCGGGFQTRSRECTSSEECTNWDRGNLESSPCNTETCDAEPTWHLTDWTVWTECRGKCGEEGRQERNRECSYEGELSSKCDIKEGEWYAEEGRILQARGCTVQCTGPSTSSPSTISTTTATTLADWGIWSTCSATCGGGTKERRRCKPGRACSSYNSNDFEKESSGCNTEPCDESDSSWGDWGPWSLCSKLCGGGKRKRERCERGQICTWVNAYKETGDCNTAPCGEATDNKWSEWGPWTKCSRSCGSGESERQRCKNGDCQTDRILCNDHACTRRAQLPPIFLQDSKRRRFTCIYGTVTFGDVDNDGNMDLICVFADGFIHIYYGTPTGPSETVDWEFQSNICRFTRTNFREYSRMNYRVSSEDYNADGYVDIICYNGVFKTLEVHISDAGYFQETPLIKENCGSCCGSKAYFTDVNGDRKSDLICGDRITRFKNIYINEYEP